MIKVIGLTFLSLLLSCEKSVVLDKLNGFTDSAPFATSVTPTSFDEDAESLIILSYSDDDDDLATSCSVNNPMNLTVTTPCACDSAGVCIVGVTGDTNLYGAASFDYTVTANEQVSNSRTLVVTIDPVDDAPSANLISPANALEDTESILTLSYNDVEGDLASSCSATNLSNITVTTPCSCDVLGVCTVGVTGLSDYSGAAGLDYSVTANGLVSNLADADFTIDPGPDAPVVANGSPASFDEDTESIINLSYTDADSDLASACNLSNLGSVSITTPCACNVGGVCTVGVTGIPNHNGAASFDYTVTANGQTSNVATNSLTIDPIDDAPIASNFTPANLTEDLESIITLSYSDVESDLATSCNLSALSNVSVSTPCTCDVAGVCTVGVTGAPNYNGAASFSFTVTANSAVSNTASAGLTIDPVNDAPVTANFSPASFDEDTESIITLGYSDVDGDLGSACGLSSLSNLTISTPCACDGAGVCTVGVTGSTDYNGAASFNYTVTAGGQTSNSSTASLTLNPVADAPIASNITPANMLEDIESIITLSYSDADGDLGSACSLSNLGNVSITTPCACSGGGVCTVGVTGAADYNGAAAFDYTVTANGLTSNVASAALTIDPASDAPVTADITPANFDEDVESIITLSYTDADSDLATLCAPSNLNNVSVSTPCSCDGAGVCVIGITSHTDYNGPGSFDYTVTAGGQLSNVSTASLTIDPVADAPVANAITPANLTEDIESIITLGYVDADGDLATVCAASNMSNVIVSTPCACDGAGVCTIGVTGTADYSGAASFDFTVTANGATSNSQTASLTIDPAADAPVTADITPTSFNEDVESIITLTYTDADNDLANACAPSNLSNVTVTTSCACDGAGVCTIGVTGIANYNGAASFDYTVTANGQLSNVSTASLTIDPVDDAPVANAITPASFNEDTESIITLSYTDVDGDLASTCTHSALSNVTVTTGCACDGAGVCTIGVTGTTDYNGAASFNFTVTANTQASNAASASLTIDPVGDAPVANAMTPSNLTEDLESIITLSYSDADGDLGTSCGPSNLTNVTVTTPCSCNGSGVCTVGITGTADYSGAGSFDFTVTANSQVSNIETATFTIDPASDAPVAANLNPASFDEDTESIITLSYTDADGDLATTCTHTGISNVTVTTGCACDGAGVCTIGVTGTSDYSGAASFTYTVDAGGETSNVATASLTIDPLNDAPVANAISPASFDEDVESIITLSYTDADGDLATACSASSLSNVTVTSACVCAAGTCTIGVTGTSNYNGVASFDYTVTANGQTSSAVAASLTIDPVADAPIADAITPPNMSEDTESIISLSYSDADGDQASACSPSNLNNVTVTTPCACAAGTCTIGVTGTSNYNGAASFDYTVTANGDTSAAASATLTIDAVSDAPVTADITPASFDEDVESVITLSYTDADGDQASACISSNLGNVSVTTPCSCDGAGVCTIGVTGAGNYNGAASFDYTVTANGQTSNTSTASLTIDPVADAPVADDITPPNMLEDAESTITLSYIDADGDLATACTPLNLSNVTVTSACVCGAGTCTIGVTGTADYNGAASFDYTVTANGLSSNVATATLTIDGVSDAPVTADIAPASFDEDTESIISLSYTDADSDLGSACALSNLSNITVTTPCACNGAGACSVGVTGTADYNGAASFDYTVTANAQVSNASTASLTIDSVADVPVADDITPANMTEDLESVITLSYSDGDGDSATACTISSVSNVTVTSACGCAAGVCTVGVTGTSDYNGAANFDYTVTANSQTSNTATASLTIDPASDAPVSADISPASFDEDTESIITLSYTDADGDAATTCALSNLSNITQSTGCACAAGVCTVGVTGSANYNGAASFDYTVTANAQTSNTSTASLVIDPVADAPVADDITPANMTEDAESTITLSYSDADGDAAVSCVLSNLVNVFETSGCACAAGVCTVGVTGAANYVGAASFDYTVTANGLTSAAATASLTIDNVDDAPVAAAISPASFDEDVESMITLSYTDADSDLATACTIANETNVSVTTGCSCAAGTCTVGVTGSADYNGAASFDYTVTANSVVSNQVSASLTIDPVNDAPVVSHNCSIFSVKDVVYSCTVSATDVDGIDTQSYSFVSNTCSFLSIDASTGVISGTPTSVGSCAFSVKSNDGTVDSNVESIPFHGTYLPPMVATYRMTSTDLDLTLPLRTGYTYNMKVDWGDGNISDVTSSGDASRTHTFSSAGDYTVYLYGVAEAFYFNSTGDRDKLISVSDLGEMGWVNLERAFAGCTNMTSFAGGVTDSVTDMDSMFLDAMALTSLDISTFNTSSVTDMSSMFSGVSSLATLDLTGAGFDTTNVTNMEYMFKDMNALTSIDLSNFTTTNVTNMLGMFRGASTLTSLDASQLETQNVTLMNSMFRGLSSLTSINLTGFNTSSATQMVSMFQASSSLASVNLSSFNTANVTTMNSMFESMTGLTSLTVTGFNTSNVTDFADMFRGVSGISTLDVSSFDTSSATTMNRMFRDVSSVSSLNISNFVTSAVTDMEGMFWGMSGLTSLTWDTTKFNTSLVQNMQYMFRDLSSMTSLNLATSGSFFDTSSVTNMGSMFLGCSGLTSLNTTGWVTSSVTNMINMFNGLSSMTTFSISHLDTSAVIDISRIFSGMSSVTTLDLSSNDTSSATNMQSMFSGMTSLTSVNTGGSFSTASVTDMYQMFYNVSSMVTLDINHWDTSNVTRIREMFGNMSSLTTLDVDLLSTVSVTDMDRVFYNASSLTSLDLSSWNVGNVTTMNGLFQGASSLNSITLTGWNTSNVNDMSEMFRETQSLPSIDTSSFNTSNVTDMSYMFLDASSITSLNLAHFNTASVTNMESMFGNTSSLTSLTSTDWDVSAVTNSANVFSGANAGLTVYCNYGNLFGETCN